MLIARIVFASKSKTTATHHLLLFHIPNHPFSPTARQMLQAVEIET